jgi:hypothetical protein
VNVYTIDFKATCPVNGDSVDYQLRIETCDVVPAESLVAEVSTLHDRLHENIADSLAALFGGRQTLAATHRGVHIETTRGGAIDPKHWLDQTVGGMAGTPGY